MGSIIVHDACYLFVTLHGSLQENCNKSESSRRALKGMFPNALYISEEMQSKCKFAQEDSEG